jgi:hypothetical protein
VLGLVDGTTYVAVAGSTALVVGVVVVVGGGHGDDDGGGGWFGLNCKRVLDFISTEVLLPPPE